MNRIKFEAYLREKLAVLHQSEIDEIINEYLQHIDMRTAEGDTEEQAIKDFGDLNVLVNEILAAYKINPSHNQFEDFSNTVKGWLNEALDYVNKIANSIMKRSGREVVALIIEFALVIVLLVAVSFTIDLIGDGILRFAYFGPYAFSRIIIFIVRMLSFLLNLIVSLSILYMFANERIIKFESKEVSSAKYAIKPKEVVRSSVKKDVEIKSNNTNKIINETDDLEATKFANIQREKAILQAKEKSFGQMLFDGNLLILRVIMLVILIPMIVVGVFLGIAFITIIYNTIIGYGSIGISLVLSGVLLIYFYVLILIIKFVSGGK